MPVVTNLPALRNTHVIDVDDSGRVVSRPLRGGETVYTALVVEDTDSRGATVPSTLAVRRVEIEDNIAPVYFDYLPSGILQADHSVRLAGASAVQDDQEDGELYLYHVLSFGDAEADKLWDIVEGPGAAANSINGAFGAHVVPADQFVPNAPISLAGFPGLAASKAVRFAADGTSWTLESVASAERKQLVSHLLARDSATRPDGTAAPNKSRIQASFEALDITPPAVSAVSASSVAATSFTATATVSDVGDANASAATAAYAGLFLRSAIPAGALPAFDKVTGAFSHNGTAALQSKALVAGANDAFSVGFAGLADLSEYAVFVAAVDSSGNASAPSAAASATFTTLDASPPTVSGFAAAQAAGSYAFSASAGTVADNKSGNVTVRLVLSAAALTIEQLAGPVAAALDADALSQPDAIKTAPYTVGGAAVPLADLLSTGRHWTGSAFAPISETSPAPPHQLKAYIVATDGAGNASSVSADVAVADRTAPQMSGAVTLAAVGSDTIKVSLTGAVADGRGISAAAVYYSTVPLGPDGLAAWKAAAASYSLTAGEVAALAAPGFVAVGGLSPATTYHAYLSVADAAGNAADFATTPASVATEAAAPPTPQQPPVAGSFNEPAAPSSLGAANNGVYTWSSDIEIPLASAGYTPDFTYIFVIKNGNASYSAAAYTLVGVERRTSGQVGRRIEYTDNHYISGSQSTSFTLSNNTALTTAYLGDSTKYRAIILRQDFSGASKVRIDVVNATGPITSQETAAAVTTEGTVHNILLYSINCTTRMYGNVKRIGQYITDDDAVAYGRYLAASADNA